MRVRGMTGYLNLGCGSRYVPDWVNVDLISTGPGVIPHDLRKGLPFPDDSFHVVYHSHLLEHFDRSDAPGFLRECLRVLRPGGAIRVVVPDLEQIVRSYLVALEQVTLGGDRVIEYEWRVCQLLDQCVRTKSGGEMSPLLAKVAKSSKALALLGHDGNAKKPAETATKPTSSSSQESEWAGGWKLLWHRLCNVKRYSHYARESLLRLLLGQDREVLVVGRFRISGEVHKWMYDRYSLARLLGESGFVAMEQRTATQSCLPNWEAFHLDADSEGTVYMTDSLYMEARKP